MQHRAIIYSLQTTRHNRIFQGPKPFTLQKDSLCCYPIHLPPLSSLRYGNRHVSAPTCSRLSVHPVSLQPYHVLHCHLCYLLRHQGMHSKPPPVSQHHLFSCPSTSAPVPTPACTSASTCIFVSCSRYASAAASSPTLPRLPSTSVNTILNFLSSPVQQHTSVALSSRLDLFYFSSQHHRKFLS
ncbi:hypothetical protein BZA77DRAFT_312203 [Pyronema omphalodes]|nr:hypothetical protein BZA77DRAFT_312203 [Pyronema omphalodes]